MQDTSDGKQNTSRQAWEQEANEVWSLSARQLSVSLRYLFVALGSLKKISDPRFAFTATDGENIYFNPMKLVTRARQGQVYINRAYVHMLMHCIFPAVRKAREYTGKERRLWDIASDIHAEYIIDGLQTQAVLLPESDLRASAYKRLTDSCGILSVENIYAHLHKETEEILAVWEELFYVDDHSPWPGVSQENADDWAKKQAAVASSLPAYGRGKGEERLFKALKVSSRKHMSYKEFLKKFMRLHETSRLDPDSFDPGYYNYGMTLYGDMPLIEELETREDNTIEEIVIVIDTSGSCAGDAVERFLNETLSLLADIRAVSDRTQIRLLQCDREIQGDLIISPSSDASKLISDMELKGFGGTDFRPPFEYARKLTGAGRRIAGMIYFTDGYGLYPTARPPWKSAFIFSKEPDFDDEERMRLAASALEKEASSAALRPPAWAMTHVL